MIQQHLLFPVNLQYFNGEKTEKATPRKKQDARKKGQVARSSDLAPAFGLTAIFLVLFLSGSWMLESFLAIVRESLTRFTLMDVNYENLGFITNQLLFESLKILGPNLGIALVISLASNYLQVGVLFTTEPLMMKLEKLNPLEGAKRIFSMRTLVELVKSILKITLGLSIAYLILKDSKDELMYLSVESIQSVLVYTAGKVAKLGLFIGMTFIFLAGLDYAYQRFEYEKSLRMSKQDIKDEYKKTEGDPLIKGKIKEKQRQMAMRRMMQELPKADVVITNPTHFAVAIKYEAGKMAAPTVIAKGQDYLALKMKEIAKKNRIVMMENKPLARALYSQVEIGEQIPEELFKAVAEVLAYVYKLQGKVR